MVNVKSVFSPAPITPPVAMTEPLCAGLSMTAAVSCTLSAHWLVWEQPEAGATWLREGAAVSSRINDAVLFIHPATLALHTALLHVVWVRSHVHAWLRDRLVSKAASGSSTQIHRCILLFLFCQIDFVPQRHLAGKAHNINASGVGKMSLNEP